MKLLSLQLPDTTRANDIDLNGCKACICADYVHAGLRFPTQRLFTRKRSECRPHKQSVVCFQDRDFGLSNVAEALQQIGVRLIKTEQIARFGEYLKRNGVSLERFHLTPASRGNALWESANRPFVKISANKDSDEKETQNHVDFEFPFVSDWMVDTSTPRGDLSVAAISCIEQFSRLNGLTGKQMRQKFYSESPVSVQNEARNLVEYCCFRYLSKSSTDFHPYLKEAAFRRLIFITMLAWQQPYGNADNNHAMVHEHENVHGSGKAWIVGEDAFTRIAPAISGVADRSTAHHLFKALTSDNEGLSFSVWNTYISELLRVHEERLQHRIDEGSTLSLNAHECVLCVGANKRQPVQMWNKNNIPWPGRLTLTERALYFEPNGMIQHRTAMKLDLQGGHGNVERKKVGPFGAPVLDSAITVSANAQSEPWILEFVDFSGHGRREVWFAFIDEILSVYSFISEYGPAVDDPFLPRVYGSQHGRKKAVTSAVNGIARVQAVQSTLGRLLEHPGRLLQFSHLKNAPCGELVKQTLAVAFWGGHLEANHRDLKRLSEDVTHATDGIGTGLHIVDVDGSVYLQRWMKSSTWESSMSSTFWKQKVGGKGLIVGKDLIVGDLTYLDKAVKACKDQSQILERTKATIDGALVKGIPSNIDLFKELMVPFTALSINVRKLQKWECPPLTVLFLAICSLVLYKNWLKFFAPALLLTTAVLVFTLHNQKLQGRLGDNFGRVIIREQPPSNTLQKIISLKEALAKVEIQIQKVNVALLKLRSLALAGHPQGKNMVAFAMLGAALILLFVPFRIVCAFLIFDQFTCELEFRRGMVLKLARQLNDWWETIPAAPVVVLPYDSHQDTNEHNIVSEVDEALPPTKGEAIAEAVREWFASEQNST